MKVPYTNDTANFKHVGGVTIPPFETREVDPSLLDGYTPPEAIKVEDDADPIKTLLESSVAVITAKISELSNEDFVKAVEFEEEGKARKSLLEAMTAEHLRRVQLDQGGEK